MPGVKIEDGKITFSQSWLSTWLRCGEQARHAITAPPTQNEQTMLGSAAHLYFEQRLLGASEEDATQAMHDYFMAWVEDPKLEWVNVKTPDTLHSHLDSVVTAWDEGVWPHLSTGVVEREFDVPLGFADDGTELRLAGTPDYDDEWLGLLDWKTAGRYWNELETKRWHIQATAYTYADAIATGTDEPRDFTYVILLKGAQPSEPQWITASRGPQDWRWLTRLGSRAYDAIKNDVWHLNDASWLCSPKWCGNWENCKGAI